MTTLANAARREKSIMSDGKEFKIFACQILKKFSKLNSALFLKSLYWCASDAWPWLAVSIRASRQYECNDQRLQDMHRHRTRNAVSMSESTQMLVQCQFRQSTTGSAVAIGWRQPRFWHWTEVMLLCIHSTATWQHLHRLRSGVTAALLLVRHNYRRSVCLDIYISAKLLNYTVWKN